MTTKEYIESGILESYVLGITTAGESAEVERMVLEHPEIEIELEAIRGTLENYALQYEKQPPAALKGKIMAAVFEEQQPLQNTRNNLVQLNNPKPQKSIFSMAASWALLTLSVGANIFFLNNWKNSEEKVVALESKNQLFAQENKSIKASYQEEVAILQNADFKVIKLLGQKPSPNSKALIYFDKTKQEVYLSALDLPAAPNGKQYQLWAIVDGKPVDAGMIAGTTNILKMKSFSKPVAFAISLENTGGSTTEAGPKGAIYVMGAV